MKAVAAIEIHRKHTLNSTFNHENLSSYFVIKTF